jgi:uncharacterized protein YceH (UPF0502 family)
VDLSPEEVRALGCLMEKQIATPDQYPLSLNSLVLACNQSTNRDPVVHYGEAVVDTAVASLRQRGLTRVVHSPSNRVPKHRHVADEVLGLDERAQAVVTVLMLRGPQTPGELKGRTERLYAFADLAAVEAAIDELAARPVPLVARLARRPGQKETRVAQLLGGPVSDDFEMGSSVAEQPALRVRLDRVGELEARVEALEAEVRRLRELFD